MKLCYGYNGQKKAMEQIVSDEVSKLADSGDTTELSRLIGNLLVQFDWINILDNEENDITSKYF